MTTLATPSAVRVPYTDFPAQFAAQREELLRAVAAVLERGDFILGEAVAAFEREFAALCGVRHAVGVANGTDALVLAMKALGVGAGDEVITPPNSWISSTSSIVLAGARPVFADVGADLLIDPERVEAAITPRTRAIMPVHLTGRCADMARLAAIARRHHLLILEDAAQAAGAQFQGRAAGSFGRAACFSLHPLKNLSAMGDGGVVVTDDDAVAASLRLLRNHGLKNRDEVAQWGWNSRLDTLQAAVLRPRLAALPAIIAARRRHAAAYREALSGVVVTPQERADERATYHVFVIQCDRRDALQRFLAERGIEAKIHYPIPIHLQEAARGLGCRAGDLPMAETQARRILSLPIHQHLADAQRDAVIEAIRAFYGGAGG
jgi:dTDP-4-amino-4,6-dideoxygalactose transaminase